MPVARHTCFRRYPESLAYADCPLIRFLDSLFRGGCGARRKRVGMTHGDTSAREGQVACVIKMLLL